MSTLVNVIRQLVREEISLNEDRLGKGLTIADADKAAKIKQLYPENNINYKIITAIENAGNYDMTRLGYKDPASGNFIRGLAQILNLKNTIFGPHVRELIASGVIADKAETAIPKKVKPQTSGVKGRKPSETSKIKIVNALINRFIENSEYTPTTQDITYTLQKSNGQTATLDQDEINKIKSIASKRSRRGEDPLLRRVNRELNEQPLHEIYRRLQKIK